MVKTLMDKFEQTNPLRIVEYLIALFTILGGLVLLTPLALLPVPGAGTPEFVGMVIGRPGIIIASFIAICSGIIHLLGLRRNKLNWRMAALFTNALVRIYSIIASWLLGIAEPAMPWNGSVLVLCIVIVIWLRHHLTPGGVDD